MKALAAVLFLAPLLLPLAAAGDAKRPEITDPVDASDPTVDITAAWFEARKEGLRFTVQVVGSERSSAFLDHVYWVAFRAGGKLGSATVGVDGRGATRGDIGPLDGPSNHFQKGPFEVAANNALLDPVSRPGIPATFSGTIPWGAVAGLEEGATMVDLQAGVAKYDRRQGQWIPAVRLDIASSNKVYVPETVRLAEWVTPALTISMAAAGAGAGAFVVLRKPAKP